jgi:hypothetical protein
MRPDHKYVINVPEEPQRWFMLCRVKSSSWKRSMKKFSKRRVFYFLEYRTMEKAQKPSSSMCYTPSVELFRIYWRSLRRQTSTDHSVKLELAGDTEVVGENLTALCSINSTWPDHESKLNRRCGRQATNRLRIALRTYDHRKLGALRHLILTTRSCFYSHLPLHIRSVQ